MKTCGTDLTMLTIVICKLPNMGPATVLIARANSSPDRFQPMLLLHMCYKALVDIFMVQSSELAHPLLRTA
jgi:hypothetical protein